MQNLTEMYGKQEPTGALEMQTVNVKDWEAAGGNWEEAKEKAIKRNKKKAKKYNKIIAENQKIRAEMKKILENQNGQGLAEFGLIIAAICGLIMLFLK